MTNLILSCVTLACILILGPLPSLTLSDEEDNEIRHSIVNVRRNVETGQKVNLFLTANGRKDSRTLGEVTTETREVAHMDNSHWRITEIKGDGGETLYTLTPDENPENVITKGESLEELKYKFKKYSDAQGYFIEQWRGNETESQPSCMFAGMPGKPVYFQNCCYACKNGKADYLWKFHPYPWDWKVEGSK